MKYVLGVIILAATAGLAWPQDTATAPAAPPAAATPAAVPVSTLQSLQNAANPSAAIELYALGVRDYGNNPRFVEAFVRRMIDLGAPQNAYEQAATLASIEPKNETALSVMAYVAMTQGRPVEAEKYAAQAYAGNPNDPFLLRGIGQLMAWYDTSADRTQIAAADKDSFEALRKQAMNNSVYMDSYKVAVAGYQQQEQDAAGGLAAAQPAYGQSPSDVIQYGAAYPDTYPDVTYNYYYDSGYGYPSWPWWGGWGWGWGWPVFGFGFFNDDFFHHHGFHHDFDDFHHHGDFNHHGDFDRRHGDFHHGDWTAGRGGTHSGLSGRSFGSHDTLLMNSRGQPNGVIRNTGNRSAFTGNTSTGGRTWSSPGAKTFGSTGGRTLGTVSPNTRMGTGTVHNFSSTPSGGSRVFGSGRTNPSLSTGGRMSMGRGGTAFSSGRSTFSSGSRTFGSGHSSSGGSHSFSGGSRSFSGGHSFGGGSGGHSFGGGGHGGGGGHR